jgi:hypothetical protein
MIGQRNRDDPEKSRRSQKGHASAIARFPEASPLYAEGLGLSIGPL